MSEQTPDSMSDHEPSMEDILASIRKLISEDDVAEDDPPIATAPAQTTPARPSLIEAVDTEADPFDLSARAPETSSEDDILDMIEFDLTENDQTDIDLTGTEALGSFAAPEAEAPPSEDILELTDIVEEITPVEKPASAAQLSDTDDAAVLNEDFENLLSDLDLELDDESFTPEPDFVTDPAESLLADEIELDAVDFEDIEAEPVNVSLGKSPSDAEDMDLVKSLMADLTGEDLEAVEAVPAEQADDGDSAAFTDELLDGLISDETVDEKAVEPVEVPGSDASPDDDLAALIAEVTADADAADQRAQTVADDDILDLIADDIVEHESGETAQAEEMSAEDHESFDAPEVGTGEADDDLAALTDVLTVGGMAAGAAAAAAAVSQRAVEKTSPSPEMAESSIIENEEPIEEHPMPQIAKTDSLAADETVEAASSAFASLNRVVEEKAVFSERGPRIGDLVQEALKPMLQEWLDANLKDIVERAVAKEVKRISSGK